MLTCLIDQTSTRCPTNQETALPPPSSSCYLRVDQMIAPAPEKKREFKTSIKPTSLQTETLPAQEQVLVGAEERTCQS